MSLPFLWIIAVHFNVVPLEFMLWVHCRISGCRHEVPGNCPILGYYTYNSEIRNKALRISMLQRPYYTAQSCMLSPAYGLIFGILFSIFGHNLNNIHILTLNNEFIDLDNCGQHQTVRCARTKVTASRTSFVIPFVRCCLH
jgi:hypothetical protein